MTPLEFEAARRKLGYTQQQLADVFGVSHSLIYSIEAGRRELRAVYALAIQALLEGVDSSDWSLTRLTNCARMFGVRTE